MTSTIWTTKSRKTLTNNTKFRPFLKTMKKTKNTRNK